MPVTAADIYAALQYGDGSRWSDSTITVSIPTASPPAVWSPFAYPAGDEPSNLAYGVLDAAQRAAFLGAVSAWEAVVDIDLVVVADDNLSQGDIRVAFTNTDDYVDDAAAYAYQPPTPGFGTGAFQGDIWVDDDFKDDPAFEGGFLYATFLHELGHALGLKHPFEGASLPAEFDNTRYTVMSYTNFPDSSLRYFELEDGSLFAKTFVLQPSTPMLLDILALQDVYGAATTTALGSDTWVIGQDEAFMATLHDNGGVDTLDLSSHTRASKVSLVPASFSSIALFPIADQIAAWTAAFPEFSAAFIADFLHRPDTYTWSNNLATSPQTVIENVRAGSGDDTIVGNSAANSLSGGAGSDSILGGQGSDTIVGGASGATWNWLRGDEGDDSLVGGAGVDNINGNMGADTVSTGAGDDFCVGGKDGDLLLGGEGFDYVYGNLGDDSCNGDGGADILRGGKGNDTLAGGAGDDFVSGDLGSDTMTGGAGADLFHAWETSGIDRVLDFNLAEGDRVFLDPGTQFTVAQVGGDTVIQMSSAQVILVGVQAASLPPGTIFGF